MTDAQASTGDEGRGKLRKVPGSRRQALIRKCPNGETPHSSPVRPQDESIVLRSEPGEVKHLSTRRKRKMTSIPPVVASEHGRAQTRRFTAWG